MILRNNNYIFLDGTLFNLEGVQSLYISRGKTGVVVQYLDGHRLEIKYANKTNVEAAWKNLLEELNDFVDGVNYMSLYDVMIIRLEAIEHIEFDYLDNRFVVLYKDGACFVFDFMSVAITRKMFKEIILAYFPQYSRGNVATSRLRADFWHKVQREINQLASGEVQPNAQYWTKIDKAIIDAGGWE